MDQHRRAALSRRRLLRWGVGAACAGAALVVARGADAVSLSGVKATVNVATLDVRSGPGTSHARVGTLSRGTSVACTATSGTWFKVSTSTLSGWAYSGNVTLVATAPAVTISRGSTAAKWSP